MIHMVYPLPTACLTMKIWPKRVGNIVCFRLCICRCLHSPLDASTILCSVAGMRKARWARKKNWVHTPTVKHKSMTEAFAYSSKVYTMTGYLEGWNVLVISQRRTKNHQQLCVNMECSIPWSMILLVGVGQCVSKHAEVVRLFPPF